MKRISCYGILSLSILLSLSCTNASSPISGLPATTLVTVFEDDSFQLTGVAVSREGRIFTNYPLWSDAHKLSVIEIQDSNGKKPFPNLLTNSWQVPENGMKKWVCVQAVRVDDSNNLWVVDPASPFQKGVYENTQKLVKISLSAGMIVRSYSLDGATDDKSYVNDVRIDPISHTAYLTNSSEGGIIVLNLLTGKVRQLLQGHFSVIADPSYTLHIDGKMFKKNGIVFKGNSDGLALTYDGKLLYYKPLTDDKLYRIETKYLLDTNISSASLGSKVQDLGHFTTTDGMEIDSSGRIYLGDLENHRIVRIDTSLKMTVLLQDNRLVWPDSYQISKDGYLFVSCSQIDRQPDFNDGVNKRTTPYKIYKIKIN